MDDTVPVDELRKERERIFHASDKWMGTVCMLQVSDVKQYTIELRTLADAQDAGTAWDLRCLIRAGLISYLPQHHPGGLPRTRAKSRADNGETSEAAALRASEAPIPGM